MAPAPIFGNVGPSCPGESRPAGGQHAAFGVENEHREPHRLVAFDQSAVVRSRIVEDDGINVQQRDFEFPADTSAPARTICHARPIGGSGERAHPDRAWDCRRRVRSSRSTIPGSSRRVKSQNLDVSSVARIERGRRACVDFRLCNPDEDRCTLHSLIFAGSRPRAIHILREVAAEFATRSMLYSIGKDSSVMLHLALKAFLRRKPPFPLLHIDTTWKFREMIAFRDATARLGLELIVHINQEGVARGINPIDSGSALHTPR